MDRTVVKAIVDREIGPLMRRLGIRHWGVVVDYDLRRSADGFEARGECNWHPDYDKAAISLDPDAFADEAEVLEVLRHELFHVVLSPFTVFLNAVKPLTRDDEVKAEMAHSVWDHASEMAVINLERMYLGLTKPAEPSP